MYFHFNILAKKNILETDLILFHSFKKLIVILLLSAFFRGVTSNVLSYKIYLTGVTNTKIQAQIPIKHQQISSLTLMKEDLNAINLMKVPLKVTLRPCKCMVCPSAH